MTSLTDGTTTILPVLVDGYAASRESRTILHPIIGSAETAVSLQPAALRSGTLQLLFTTLADAVAAADALAVATVWTLTDDDQASIGMMFVVTDAIEPSLDPESRELGLVSFSFQELS